MGLLAYKEMKTQFDAAMEEAFALQGAYYILHKTALLLEQSATQARDRNGFRVTPMRKKEMVDEAASIRAMARALKN